VGKKKEEEGKKKEVNDGHWEGRGVPVCTVEFTHLRENVSGGKVEFSNSKGMYNTRTKKEKEERGVSWRGGERRKNAISID